MNEQQLNAVTAWISNNKNRPLTFMEKEVLKSLIDQSYTVGDLINNLTGLAGMLK